MTCRSAGGSAMLFARLDPREEDLVRYVIAAAVFAFFVGWDMLYNHSENIARGVRVLYQAVHWIGV
jgi:hypothetical protein